LAHVHIVMASSSNRFVIVIGVCIIIISGIVYLTSLGSNNNNNNKFMVFAQVNLPEKSSTIIINSANGTNSNPLIMLGIIPLLLPLPIWMKLSASIMADIL